ncbi:MAG: hypothetical protein BGO01_19600 [Armatimonadetes bacterium 55-13]|nr:hypothetical protein [Armatimonadota bacterium]OJU64319.1 MAG: hypothetical protein BGO01_19600 [Armatimonadetes bacterium 55-13]
MKNQNDIIISVVAIVLALIIMGVCIGTKREPLTMSPPEVVNLGELQTPNGDIKWDNSLPGAGGGNSGGLGGGRGPGGPGGPSMGGPRGGKGGIGAAAASPMAPK